MFVDKVFIRPHGTNEVSLSWTSESAHCRSYIFINGSLVVSGFMAGMTGRNATLPVPSHSTFLIEVHEFTDENTLPNSTEPSPHVRPLIAWSSSDVIEPASDIDIGVNIPAGGYFRNPPDENTIPEGITFGYYPSQDECLIVESLAGGQSVGIWIRQTIIDGTQAREGIEGDINMAWY